MTDLRALVVKPHRLSATGFLGELRGSEDGLKGQAVCGLPGQPHAHASRNSVVSFVIARKPHSA